MQDQFMYCIKKTEIQIKALSVLCPFLFSFSPGARCSRLASLIEVIGRWSLIEVSLYPIISSICKAVFCAACGLVWFLWKEHVKQSCCTWCPCSEFQIASPDVSHSVFFSLFSRCPPGVNLPKKSGAQRRRVQVLHMHRSDLLQYFTEKDDSNCCRNTNEILTAVKIKSHLLTF